ncbi:hypothetical protein [Paraburkholderia sp. PGU16]|uniref:Uncharacterized protein n=1 Tax=Paraburkholderia largidicola TaxID=3014751 RepID=A0A7I8BTX1_9BURK|nr:hypothetical protein [Paraburkholderia sp. PGU16]BCF92256.1 hypothetical protein PPGU16_53230 [Paraburkholderia sp. PGU16]BEU23661.1 hypothetical protein PBP221_38010 [Paraburkholderia sp. 22B1P]GJH33634.1 hypothetical protein CBA19CS91_12775 [Paraburkholderia hospita]
MTSRLAVLAAAESDVRARMAVSRANLVAAREAARGLQGASRPSLTLRARELVSTAPNVMLLAAVLVGSLVIGPRRIVGVVVRNGLVAWIAKTVRRVAGN